MTHARLPLLLLLLLLLLSPLAAPVSAQGINKDDPCFKTLTNPTLWKNTLWASAEQQTLGRALQRVDAALWANRALLNAYAGSLGGVIARFPTETTSLAATNSYFEGWDEVVIVAVIDCLPWMKDFLSRLEDRLRALGGASGTIGAAPARPGVQVNKEIEEMKQEMDELKQRLEQRLLELVTAKARRP
jgi:hypothetical protein